MTNLKEAIREASEWLTELARTGPDLTVNAHKKAAKEAIELVENPSLEEMADVIICLVGTALYHDWTLSQVVEAVNQKTVINRGRTWFQESDGTWRHHS